MVRKELPEVGKMGQAINWRDEVAAVAGPLTPGDTRESWLSRAARRAKVNYRLVKGLWYREVSEPRLARCAVWIAPEIRS